MVKFEDVYTKPFIKDPNGSYVWDSKNRMTFMCLTYNDLFIQELVDKLNGSSKIQYNASFKEGVIYIDDKPMLAVRGWGRLNAVLKLSPEKAAKIQDDFCEWVVKTLKE